jgi:hypothetical protein
MASKIMSDFFSADLHEIVQKLEELYYDQIEVYCGNVERTVASIEVEEHAASTLYVSLCIKLVEKINHHIRLRKMITIPYVQQLHEKVLTGHDCSTCEDGCQINHKLKAGTVKETHVQIKEMLNRLQLLSKPLYTDYATPDSYRQLRNDIVLMDTKLTELFYVEDAVLLPRIIEAQRKIHVRS